MVAEELNENNAVITAQERQTNGEEWYKKTCTERNIILDAGHYVRCGVELTKFFFSNLGNGITIEPRQIRFDTEENITGAKASAEAAKVCMI